MSLVGLSNNLQLLEAFSMSCRRFCALRLPQGAQAHLRTLRVSAELRRDLVLLGKNLLDGLIQPALAASLANRARPWSYVKHTSCRRCRGSRAAGALDRYRCSTPSFVHQILDREPAERGATAGPAQAGRGLPGFLAVEGRPRRHELGHGHTALGDRDLHAARDLGKQRAQAVLGFEGGNFQGSPRYLAI